MFVFSTDAQTLVAKELTFSFIIEISRILAILINDLYVQPPSLSAASTQHFLIRVEILVKSFSNGEKMQVHSHYQQ